MSKIATAVVVPCSVVALLLAPARNVASATPPNRNAAPADHTIDAEGFVAHDLTHGNGALRLELNRQWRGSSTLNSRFGAGWSDQNDFRLRMLSANLVVIERGGVGWREAYRKDDKNFAGPEGDKIQKTDQGWTVQIAPGFVYNFDGKGRLTSIKPPAGAPRNYTYDDKGRLVSVGTGGQNSLQYQYNNQNRVTSVRGPEGLQAGYQYDSNGRLTAVTTARAYRVQYDYGADGSLTSARDQLGSGVLLSQLSATIPAPAKAPAQPQAAPDTSKYQFDAQGRPTAVTENGSTKSYKYDASGALTEISDGKQGAKCEYDAFGRMISVQAADGSSTKLEYNKLDLPTKVTKADGTVVTLKYDEHGRTIRTERSPTDWEEVGYDDAGRIAVRKTPPAFEAHYEYGDGDRVSRLKYSTGRELTFTYDSNGNLLSESSSTGESRTWRYDRNGFLVESVNASGLKTTYTYNAAGRLTAKEDSVHGKTTYQSTANGEVEESALGKTTTRLSEWGKPLEVIAPGGGRTAYTYDAGGSLESVLSPSQVTWKYEHDFSGKLTALIGPSGLRTLISWDSAGRQTRITRGDVTWREYRYDRDGGWREEQSGTGRAARYTYGTDKRPTAVELPNGKIAFENGNNGLQVRETGPGYVVQNEYNSDGTLRRRNYTASQLDLKLPMDASGRVAGVELNELKAAYSYDNGGQITAIKLPNGTSIEVSNDRAGRPSQVTFGKSLVEKIAYDRADRISGIEATEKNGKSVFNETYQIDTAGNLSARNTDGVKFKFGYDREARLINASSPNNARKFSYDVDGNLTTDGDGKTRCRVDRLGRPLELEAIAYVWDKAGNLTQVRTPKGKIDNVFDAAGRLTERRDAKKTWRFSYDAANNRLSEEGPAGKRAFAYLDDRLGGFKDESGTNWLIVYLPGTDQPIALCGSNKKTLFVVSDRLGSMRRFVDEQGNVVATNDYTVFGNILAAKGKAPIALYAGMVRDDSGLSYARQRYYDASIGRFISMDPLFGTPGYPASHNIYAYAANNPLRYRDPMGTGFEFDVQKYWYRPDMEQHRYEALTAEEKAAVKANYDAVSKARQTMQNPASSPSEVKAAEQALTAHDAELDRLNELGKLRYQHKIATVAELDDFQGKGVYSAEGAKRNSQMIADSEAKIKAMGADPLAPYSDAGKERIAANAAKKADPAAAQKAADEAAAAQKAAAEQAAAQKAAEEAASADRDAKAAGAFKRGSETNPGENVKVDDPNKTGAVPNQSVKAGEGTAEAGTESDAAKKALVPQNQKATDGGSKAGVAGENIGESSGVHDPGILKDGSPRDIDMQKNANGVWEKKPTKANPNDASNLSDADEPYRPGGADSGRPAPKGDIDMKLDSDGVWKPKGIPGGGGAIGEGAGTGERWLGPMIIEQGGKVLKWLKPIGETLGPIAELIGTADLAAKMANNFIDTLNEPFMEQKRQRDAAKAAEEKYKADLATFAAADPDNIVTRDGHKFDPKNPSDMEDLMNDLSSNLYYGRPVYGGLFKDGKISQKAWAAPTTFMGAANGDTALPTALADAWNKMKTAVEKAKAAADAAKECIRQQDEAKSQLESAVKNCGTRGYLESDISQLPVVADDTKKQTETVKAQTKTLSQAYADMSAAIDKTDDTAIKVCQLANDSAGASPDKVADLKAKATQELQSATDMLNNAQAKLDGADFAVDQLSASKAKLEGFRTTQMAFKMGNGAAEEATTSPADMMAAAKTAADAATKARSQLDPLVADVKSLGSQIVGLVAPYVATDPEAAALSAAAQNLGSDIPDVGFFDFGMLVSMASPIVNAFIANQKAVETAIGKVDIDAIATAADDALQAAASVRETAKKLASGPDRYQGLQSASVCFGMMSSGTPADNSAQASPGAGGSPGPSNTSNSNLAAVPAIDDIKTAEAVITAAGFTPSITGLAPSSKDQEFKLAGQTPGAGEMLERGKPVTVYVYQSYSDTLSPTPTPMTMAQNSPSSSASPSASGSASGTATMPNLVGLTVDQASTRLTKNMRIGNVDVGTKPPSPEKAMTIFVQNPAANTKINPDKMLTVTVKAYGSAKSDEPASNNQGSDGFVGSWIGKSWYAGNGSYDERGNIKDHEIVIKKAEAGPGYTIFVPPHMDFGYPIASDGPNKLSHVFGIYNITWTLSGNTMQGACWYTDYTGARHDLQCTLTRK